MKYTEVDRENLRELLGTEGLESVFKLLDGLVRNMEKDVVNFDLNTGNFSNLGIAKAKLDGARLLVNRAKKQITDLKGEKPHGRK